MGSEMCIRDRYGTTKRYAEQLSEMINLPVISYEDIKELTEYDLIVHFGGLYAGGVKGLKRIIKVLGENTQLIIVTVGLADVYDKENTDNIRKSIRKQVPERILSNSNIFHLRGGIDYDKFIVVQLSRHKFNLFIMNRYM